MALAPKSVDVNVDKEKFKLYREPGDDQSMGMGLLAARERAKHAPGSRLSHQPTHAVHDSNTPTSNVRKAADLIA